MMMAKPAATLQQLDFIAPLKEKWLPIIIKLLLVCALMFMVWNIRQWLLDPVNLPLKNINVDGEFAQLQEADIQQVMHSKLNTGFFTLDVSGVRKQIELLPWVDRVTVRRVWRDTLNVHVIEQQPIANWGEKELLNQRGEVFAPTKNIKEQSLPLLHGPVGHELQVMQMYKIMNMMLERIDLGVYALKMDTRRAWHLELTNNIVIELGRINMQARLQRFIQAYPIVLAYAAERIQSVDLRYSNGFSVRWYLENSNKQAS